MSRRAVLAAAGSVITSTAFTGSAAATEFTNGDELQHPEIENPSEWSSLKHSLGEDAHTVYIWYHGSEYRDDAERLSNHLTIAQKYVHENFLAPPPEHESQFLMVPAEEYWRGADSTGAWIDWSETDQTTRTVMQMVPPSDHPAVSTDEGISSGYLSGVLIAYWLVPEHHRLGHKYSDAPVGKHQRVTPEWMQKGIRVYVSATKFAPRRPATADEATLKFAHRVAETGEISFDPIQDPDDPELNYFSGQLLVEFMVSEWGWEQTLDVYFDDSNIEVRVRELLGVSASEFNSRFIAYIEENYTPPTPTPTPTSTPTPESTSTPTPTVTTSNDVGQDQDDEIPWWAVVGGGTVGSAAIAGLVHKLRSTQEQGNDRDQVVDTDTESGQ